MIGPSMSGKSVKVLKLLENDQSIFDRQFHQVMYASPTAQDTDYGYLRQMQNVCDGTKKKLVIVDRVPTVKEVREYFATEPVLLILDDVMCFQDKSTLIVLSSMHVHHSQISVIFCIQNPYEKGNAKFNVQSLSRNCTGRFLFHQVSDKLVFRFLNLSLFPEKKNFLSECISFAKSQYKLNYIYVNCEYFTNLPENYRCYTGLFPGESETPIFFDACKKNPRD